MMRRGCSLNVTCVRETSSLPTSDVRVKSQMSKPSMTIKNKDHHNNKVKWIQTDRRMSTLFAKSQHWQDYEVFAPQKLASFQSAQPAVVELAIRDQEHRQLAAVETRTDDEGTRSPGQAEKLVLGIATVRDEQGSFSTPEAVDQVGYGHPPLSEKELDAVRFLFGRWNRL